MEHAFIAPVSFLLTLVYASFVEWTIHRYLHRPTVWFRHLFRSHVQGGMSLGLTIGVKYLDTDEDRVATRLFE